MHSQAGNVINIIAKPPIYYIDAVLPPRRAIVVAVVVGIPRLKSC